MAKKVREPIPEFKTLNEVAEFWDTHSTADYDDLTHAVKFEIHLHSPIESQTIALLPELSETIKAIARAQGVSAETLINVWLTEKVRELV